MARRARMIPFNSIRDDGLRVEKPFGYDGTDHFRKSMKWSAENYQRKRLHGQPVIPILICEAVGMLPQVARVAEDYGVTAQSRGGYDSRRSGSPPWTRPPSSSTWAIWIQAARTFSRD